uniref:Protein kinase domain-containing protein n=1 Tax=Globisporangium ultimum (strain ATCC 200006 / CBS 805.95 / DAOM BR144) TaxID=431595 RepID=K3X2D0_GLOUD
MGATQSSSSALCCGNGNDDGRALLHPAKRRGSKDTNGHVALRPVPSRPKAIKVQTPAYSEGGLEGKYAMIEQIGHGSTSIVYRCQDKRKGGLYACKIIDRRLIETKRNELLQQFQVEIQVLQSMNHPNIIHIEDVYLSDTKICMVTEYMDGGELFDYIVEKGTLSEVEASTFVRKITSAVAYMHACGVIHRDLKPENLMLTSRSPHAEVKIIDFGLAKLLDPDDTTESFLGTRGYLAPEMLQRKAYTMGVDIWALGVIVYILLCGCLPFNDDGARILNENAARAKFGLRFPRWASGLSESAKDLLRHLLEVDASKRYTAEQALAHPWVTGQQTPNKFLRSPNYLANIKKERAQARNQPSQRSNGNGHQNGNGSKAYDDQDLHRINARRQSH